MPKATQTRRSAAPSPAIPLQSYELPQTPKGAPHVNAIPEIPTSVLNTTPGPVQTPRSPPQVYHPYRNSSKSRSRSVATGPRTLSEIADLSVVVSATPEIAHLSRSPPASRSSRKSSQPRSSSEAARSPTPSDLSNLSTRAYASGDEGRAPARSDAFSQDGQPPGVMAKVKRKFFVPRVKEESIEATIPSIDPFPAPFNFTWPLEAPLDPESSDYLCKMDEQIHRAGAHTLRSVENTEKTLAALARENQRAAVNMIAEIKRLDRMAGDIAKTCRYDKAFKLYYKCEAQRVLEVLKAGGDPYPGRWKGEAVGSDDEDVETQEHPDSGKRPRQGDDEENGEERPAKRPRVRAVYKRALEEMRRLVEKVGPPCSSNPKDDPFGSIDAGAGAASDDSDDDGDAPPQPQSTSKSKGKRSVRKLTPKPVPQRVPPRGGNPFEGPEPQFIHFWPVVVGLKDPQAQASAPAAAHDAAELGPYPGAAQSDELVAVYRKVPSPSASPSHLPEAINGSNISPDAGEVRELSDPDLPDDMSSEDAPPRVCGPHFDGDVHMPRDALDGRDVFGPAIANPASRRNSSGRTPVSRPVLLDLPADGLPGVDDESSPAGSPSGYHNSPPTAGPSVLTRPPLAGPRFCGQQRTLPLGALLTAHFLARSRDLQNTDSEDGMTDEEVQAGFNPLTLRPGSPRPTRNRLDVDDRGMDPPRTVPEISENGSGAELRELAQTGIARSIEPEMLLMSPPR
ncbi:hypothetical protein DAEQUDRAFT_768644 [Daedalea quercina L-15889]|uniref:Uncharacterized protein n=1 Tax=Daedalea quercina L-15889 TaxID=1314783 RepID=A0A165MHU9_9APHY|nr:hypothetical protein DAEQUDRAFT_768644 [Daedalea quercina L-15889]